MKRRKSFLAFVFFAVFAFGTVVLSGVLHAADNRDPTGTWKWAFRREDNVTVNYSFKLKLENAKLTGTVTRPNNQKVEIEDGSFKDGEVKFTVKVKGPNRTISTEYKGKLDGDKITGTYESDRKGDSPTGKWEPTREKTD